MLIKSLITSTTNPNAEHWMLCNELGNYYNSSAKFYENGVDGFGFLKHIGEVIQFITDSSVYAGFVGIVMTSPNTFQENF